MNALFLITFLSFLSYVPSLHCGSKKQDRPDNFQKLAELLPLPNSFSAKHNLPAKFLVLDLDETLIHSIDTSTNGTSATNILLAKSSFNVLKRTHFDTLLEFIRTNFHVIVYTASVLRGYADGVVEKIDPQHEFIVATLSRNDCIESNGQFYKQLSKLSSAMPDLLIVDDKPWSYVDDDGNPSNEYILQISPWRGEQNDDQLLQLLRILQCWIESGLSGNEFVKQMIESTSVPVTNCDSLSEGSASQKSTGAESRNSKELTDFPNRARNKAIKKKHFQTQQN